MKTKITILSLSIFFSACGFAQKQENPFIKPSQINNANGDCIKASVINKIMQEKLALLKAAQKAKPASDRVKLASSINNNGSSSIYIPNYFKFKGIINGEKVYFDTRKGVFVKEGDLSEK